MITIVHGYPSQEETYPHVGIGNTWGRQWQAWSNIAKKKHQSNGWESEAQFGWEEKKAVCEYEKMVTSITHSSLESRDQRNKQLNRGGDLFERQIGMQKGFFFV